MRGKTLENAMLITKQYAKFVVGDGDICIDATIGNGYDTLLLSNLVGKEGKVYGFDVQEVAVENTRNKLKTEGVYDNCVLLCDGHENMAGHVSEPVDFVIFNLGYLPKADKSVKTHKETTIKAIKAALSLLKPFGILWVVVYSGHEEGMEEAQALEVFLGGLSQKDYSVVKMSFMNQANKPPYILAVEEKCL